MYSITLAKYGSNESTLTLPDIRLVYFSGLYDFIKKIISELFFWRNSTIAQLKKIQSNSVDVKLPSYEFLKFKTFMKNFINRFENGYRIIKVLEQTTNIERDTNRSTRPKPVATGKYDKYGNPYYYSSTK